MTHNGWDSRNRGFQHFNWGLNQLHPHIYADDHLHEDEEDLDLIQNLDDPAKNSGVEYLKELCHVHPQSSHLLMIEVNVSWVIMFLPLTNHVQYQIWAHHQHQHLFKHQFLLVVNSWASDDGAPILKKLPWRCPWSGHIHMFYSYTV